MYKSRRLPRRCLFDRKRYRIASGSHKLLSKRYPRFLYYLTIRKSCPPNLSHYIPHLPALCLPSPHSPPHYTFSRTHHHSMRTRTQQTPQAHHRPLYNDAITGSQKRGSFTNTCPSPPLLSLKPFDSSTLPPGAIIPPGLNLAAPPTTPITPAVLGKWPNDTWDALGMASPTKAEFFLGDRVSVSVDWRLTGAGCLISWVWGENLGGPVVISTRLVVYTMLVIFLAGLLGNNVQHWMWKWANPLLQECRCGISCFFGTSCG